MGAHRISENHLPPHESEKLDMTTSETWEDFESALTSVLLDLEEREMITIKLAGGKVPFIQFAGLGSLNGVDEIRAEFSAENIKGDRGASTTFTPEQRAYFTHAGFAVAKEGLVWRRGYRRKFTGASEPFRNAADRDLPATSQSSPGAVSGRRR